VPAFFSALDGVFRGVHYGSDAEGLVVVVDCDETELHDAAHEKAGGSAERCRFCQTRKIIARAQSQVKARQGRAALKVAIGLAVPAIEAWYLVGKNHQVGEAAWRAGLTSGRPPLDKRNLKQLVYGTNRPSLEHETECAIRESRRIVQDIKTIEAAFPDGFGLMANEIRSWVSKT
jgi:hypothetical protein